MLPLVLSFFQYKILNSLFFSLNLSSQPVAPFCHIVCFMMVAFKGGFWQGQILMKQIRLGIKKKEIQVITHFHYIIFQHCISSSNGIHFLCISEHCFSKQYSIYCICLRGNSEFVLVFHSTRYQWHIFILFFLKIEESSHVHLQDELPEFWVL